MDRRRLLLTAAALALAPRAARAAPPTPVPEGRPGEFDFLAGRWSIHNRRLVAGAEDRWEEFPGESTCWTVLGGVGSIEELRIPARSFSGMGLRLLDLEKKQWNDFWVSGKAGVLAPPGLVGGFRDGVGTFEAEDRDGDTPVLVRGVWDQITPRSCRWYQATSRDGGATWRQDWVMRWTRTAPR